MEHVHAEVDALVESQIRRWLAEREKWREDARREEPPTIQPVITISREFGARGAEIGALVGEELHFSVWDHEIVHAIAERSGARERMLDSVDETARGAILDMLSSWRGDEAALAYARQLGGVIRSVAHHGAAVIVGRGGQFIVRDDPSFRVRIIQPLEERVADFASRHHLNQESARNRVETVERDRQAFCRQHFDRDVALPHHYDVVVNRMGKTVTQTVAVIVGAYRALHGT
jgi:cytidylate kinase